jgi:hypothetical protein
MVKALRITLGGNIPYENVKIYDADDMPFPNLFEDSQFAFTCKHGAFILPDYNVVVIQLRRGRVSPPIGALKVKRILLSDDLTYQDCYVIDKTRFADYGIPQLFREDEQLAFICKDGLFICPDFQVSVVQVA